MTYSKPRIEAFTDEDGYVDYYEYDMACDYWLEDKTMHNGMLAPRLSENWCGLPAQPEVADFSLADLLQSIAA